ncbi:hypothetical protein G4B88_027950 [Cannabis sativa]|uniref:PD-(D/E)XK endonuclease-like domain-containing protein n=1 Tax=Cannabis sativa TaxID=3483 RepID=A0A7J6I841_CANSA|nr:hypothetical protein G4B88_027950 [Cannabis sativa]
MNPLMKFLLTIISALIMMDLRTIDGLFCCSEWCEKQKEFSLLGKRYVNKAMKKGIARHAKLEEEVVKKVKVTVKSVEDRWALKVSFVEGVWIVRVIDEIRMPITETDKHPLLVDTKTRVRPTLPSEPQRRNGRFQLMCYKRMWDSLVSDNFPTKKFFDFYNLNPYNNLSEEIVDRTRNVGFPAQVKDSRFSNLRFSDTFYFVCVPKFIYLCRP